MIRQFADALVEAFASEKLPPDLTNESDFERRFAIPVATRVAAQFPTVEFFVHPAPGAQCHPTCDDVSGRAFGCPDCWAATQAVGVCCRIRHSAYLRHGGAGRHADTRS
jgi:hypothetical protein